MEKLQITRLFFGTNRYFLPKDDIVRLLSARSVDPETRVFKGRSSGESLKQLVKN